MAKLSNKALADEYIRIHALWKPLETLLESLKKEIKERDARLLASNGDIVYVATSSRNIADTDKLKALLGKKYKDYCVDVPVKTVTIARK